MSPLGFEDELPLSITMYLAVHALSSHELLSARARHARHKTMVCVQKYGTSYKKMSRLTGLHTPVCVPVLSLYVFRFKYTHSFTRIICIRVCNINLRPYACRLSVPILVIYPLNVNFMTCTVSACTLHTYSG